MKIFEPPPYIISDADKCRNIILFMLDKKLASFYRHTISWFNEYTKHGVGKFKGYTTTILIDDFLFEFKKSYSEYKMLMLQKALLCNMESRFDRNNLKQAFTRFEILEEGLADIIRLDRRFLSCLNGLKSCYRSYFYYLNFYFDFDGDDFLFENCIDWHMNNDGRCYPEMEFFAQNTLIN